MGEAPDDIREEIEATRERMGETAEALAYKADVKTRVKESVSDKKDAVVGTLSSGKDTIVGGADAVVSRVSGVVPDRQQVRSGAKKVGVSAENPLGLAIAGAAAGFILGTLIPTTKVEDEHLGEMSDQVVDAAKQTGQEAVDRAGHVAQETMQTVRESTQQQSKELASNLQDKAQEVASQSGA
jgi:gas vesicle protein